MVDPDRLPRPGFENLHGRVQATVVHIEDGDTPYVSIPGYRGRLPIRLGQADAPEDAHHAGERVQRWGPQATAYARERLLGKVVTLDFGRSTQWTYGRAVADVSSDGRMFSEDLVSRGLAKAAYGPSNRVVKAQNEAILGHQGIWSDAHPVGGDTYRHRVKGNAGNEHLYDQGNFVDRNMESIRAHASTAAGPQGSSILDQVMPKLYDVQVDEKTGRHQAWLMDPNAPVRRRALARMHGIDTTGQPSQVMHAYQQLLREVYGSTQDPDQVRARTMQNYERLQNTPTWGEISPLYALSGGQYGDRGPISSLLMHAAVQMDLHMNRKRAEQYSMGNFYRPDQSSQTTMGEDAVGGLDGITNLVLNSASYQFAALPMMNAANALRDALIHHGSATVKQGVLREAAGNGNGLAQGIVRMAEWAENQQNRLFQYFTAPFMEDTLLPAAKVYDWIMNKSGPDGLAHYIEKGVTALRDRTTSPAEKAILGYEYSEQAYRTNMRPLGLVNKAMESIRMAVVGTRDVDGVFSAIGRAIVGERRWSTVATAIQHGGEAAYQNLGRSSQVHVAGSTRTVMTRYAGLTGFRNGTMIAVGGFIAFTLADYLIGRFDRMGRVDTAVQRQVENALNPLAVAAGRQEMHFLPTPGRGSDPRFGLFDPVWQTFKALGFEQASALLPRLRLAWETTQGSNFAVSGSLAQGATLIERAHGAEAAGDLKRAQYLMGLARLSPNAAQVDGGAGMQSSSWAFQISPMPLLGTYNFAVRESFESDPSSGKTSRVQRFSLGIQASVLIEAGTSFDLPIMLRSSEDHVNHRTTFSLAWDPTEKFTPLVSAAMTSYGLYTLANVGYQGFHMIRARTGGGVVTTSLFEASGWVGKAVAAPFIIKALPATSLWFTARAANAGAARLASMSWNSPAWGDMPSLVKFHENMRAGAPGRGYAFVRGAGRATAVTAALGVVASFATAVWGNSNTQDATSFFKGMADNVMAFGRHVGGDAGEGMARAIMTYFPYYYPNHPDAGKVMRKDPFGGQNVGAQKTAYVTPGTWFQRQVIDPLSALFTVDLAKGQVGPLYLGTGARFMSIGPFGVAERNVTRDEKAWGTLYAQIGLMPFQPGTAMQISRAVTTVMRNTDPGKFDTRYLNDLLSGTVDPELKGRRVLERKSPMVLGTMWHPDAPIFDTQSMATSFEVRRRMAMADWIRHVDGYDVFAYREDPRMVRWHNNSNHIFTVSMSGRQGITMKFTHLLQFLKGEDMQGNFGELDDMDSMAANPMSDVIHGRPAAAKAASASLLSAFQDQALQSWAAASATVGLVGMVGIGAIVWRYRQGVAQRLRQHGTHVPRSQVVGFGTNNKFMTGAPDATRGFMFGIGTRVYVNRVDHGAGMSPLMTRQEAQELHSLYSNTRGLWEKATRPSAVVTRGNMLHTAVEMETLLKFLRNSTDPAMRQVFNDLSEVKSFLRMFRIWDRRTNGTVAPVASISVPTAIQEQFERAGNALNQFLLRDFHERFNLQIASPGMYADVYGGGGIRSLMMRAAGAFMSVVDDVFGRNGYPPVKAVMSSFTEAWNNAANRAAARRFSVSPSALADFDELWRLNQAAIRAGGPTNMFDYAMRQSAIPIDPAELADYRKSFWGRFDTSVKFARNRVGHGIKGGLKGGVAILDKVMGWSYKIRTGVSAVYMGAGMLDSSLDRNVRIQMGGGAMTEGTEFALLTVGAGLVTAGIVAGIGAISTALAGAGLIAGAIALPALAVGALGVGIGIGMAVAFDNLVAKQDWWKKLTRSAATRWVDFQESLGAAGNGFFSGVGSIFRNMTETFQDMADRTMTSFLKSNAPDWAKGFMEAAYQFALRPMSERAMQYFNPNEVKQSLSSTNSLFRQGPIWHGHIRDAGLIELTNQERTRLGSQSGAMYSLYPQSYFGMVGRDERLEIPLRTSVGAASFFKPTTLVDEVLADQMRARAVSYQMLLGKLLNRTESLMLGDKLMTLEDSTGRRIDPETYKLSWDRNTTKRMYVERLRRAAIEVSKQTGVRPALIMGIARQESSLQQFATNSQTISGLMQISKGIGDSYAKRLGIKGYVHSRDAFDPKINLLIGSAYMADLIKHYKGNERYAVMAYHIGEGAMDRRLKSGSIAGRAIDGADPVRRVQDIVDGYAPAEENAIREMLQRDNQPKPNAARPNTVTTIVVPNAQPPKAPKAAVDTRATVPAVPMGERKVKKNPDGSVTVPRHTTIGAHQAGSHTGADTTPPSNVRQNHDTVKKR